MAIKKGMIKQIYDFFGDEEIYEEWMLNHISVSCSDSDKTVQITIDNINEQEYQWFKDEI